jgi:hypothetical protein
MTKINENSTAFRAATLGALLARHYPDATPHRISMVVAQMQTTARAAVAWELRCCNESMDEKQNDRGRLRIVNMQTKINSTLYDLTPRPVGVEHLEHPKLSLGGDVRGSCAHLTIPGQTGDGWGDGFAIY